MLINEELSDNEDPFVHPLITPFQNERNHRMQHNEKVQFSFLICLATRFYGM